jgi:hypothetical protein
MSDYSFMKTGLLASETHQDTKQMLRKVVSLLKILMTQSMKTAEKFVTACGRNIIAAQDIKLALKYEAHEFMQRDFDNEFFENLREPELSGPDQRPQFFFKTFFRLPKFKLF